MLFWNKEYQAYDLVISSVTTKVKGVGLTSMTDIGDLVWDVVEHSGTSQVNSCLVLCTYLLLNHNHMQVLINAVTSRGRTLFLWSPILSSRRNSSKANVQR